MLCRIVWFCVFGISQLRSTDGSSIGIISKDVVLPCTFQPTQLSDIVLHWMRILSSKTIVVHSFYRETDQLSNQDQSYKGRTKLFTDEIMKGNASLQLTGVNKTDEGEYQCYISTSEGKRELNILLEVAAYWKNVELRPPNMLSPAANVTCSVYGTYPKPSLIWRDEDGNDLTDGTSLKESLDAEALHSVTSILKIDQTSNITYTCNIKNERLQQSWNATWKMQDRLNKTESETITITCGNFSKNDQNLTITWRFRKTEVSPFVMKCGSVHQYGDVCSSCKMSQSEKLNNTPCSFLELQHVTSEDAGEYICEIKTRDTMQVFTYILRIDSRMQEKRQKYHFGAIAAVLLLISVIALVLLKQLPDLYRC
ncbi:V-set domain-containing T-cell activation inhibitor 1-like [Cetorhinus maximus]